MLQYILNLSAIWLISLVVFDLFLRRESYHEYNRFYLLLTFVAGIFLPLYQYSNHTVFAMVTHPVQQVFAAKQFMQATATRISAESSIDWLLVIWISGMLIAMCLLVIDIIRLITFYNGGKRWTQGKWTIVETHKEHAPFSFLNILFVSSRKLYDADEWHMLLLHERQHARLAHFADVALLQLARVVFWFHPLVYIYNNRLSLVHEYQADSASGQDPQVYSRFLVEQMMLQSAPSVAHALSNAPIKNRIQMLTHKSRNYRQPAKLLVFPLIALFIICFTRYDIEYQAIGSNPEQYIASQSAPCTLPASVPVQNAGGNYNTYREDKQAVKAKSGRMIPQAMVYSTGVNTGMRYNDAVIQLGGMENNTNAKCCSSNLLWGSNYAGVVPANCYPDKQPVLLAEYAAANACTPGFDKCRKDQYMHAVETYRKVQESWSEHTADNSIALIGLPGKTGQITIADDPWNQRTDISPGMVPPLSLDRSVFGPNTKTIYDDAVAIAQRKEKAGIRSTPTNKTNAFIP